MVTWMPKVIYLQVKIHCRRCRNRLPGATSMKVLAPLRCTSDNSAFGSRRGRDNLICLMSCISGFYPNNLIGHYSQTVRLSRDTRSHRPELPRYSTEHVPNESSF
jgi:hypothetical protein